MNKKQYNKCVHAYDEMGNILILAYKYFCAPTRSYRNCEPKTSSVGTQTFTKLTEKLTDFNSTAVGSTEVFDKICDICNLDKEAVGYCWNCEQYLCLRCRSHHEKISLSQNHKLIGKSELTKVGLKKSLFEKSLIAGTQRCIPYCESPKCNGPPSCKHNYLHFIHAIFYVKRGQATCFMISNNNPQQYAFVTINHEGKYNLMQQTHSPYREDKFKEVVHYYSFGQTAHVLLSSEDGSTAIRKMFDVDGILGGVIPFGGGLAVLVFLPTLYCLPDWQIQFLDMDGNVKKRIDCYDAKGRPMFKDPQKMCCNVTNDILFVSDVTKHCVVAIDSTGKVLYKFTHTEIDSPTALACDHEGNVYVACNNKMIQIDSHGKKCRVILECRYENSYITGIYYNVTSQQLVVTKDCKNKTIVTFFYFEEGFSYQHARVSHSKLST